MLDVFLCDWCPISSLVCLFLLPHSLALHLPGLGCRGLYGVTSACHLLPSYVAQPLTTPVAYSLFVGVYFSLLRLPFFELCMDSPVRPFIYRFPALPCASSSLCRNIRPRSGGAGLHRFSISFGMLGGNGPIHYICITSSFDPHGTLCPAVVIFDGMCIASVITAIRFPYATGYR
jgi:hypothetical protein